MGKEGELGTTLATLLANGVLVNHVEPVADGGRLLSCLVVDRFGCEIPYIILHAPRGASDAVLGLAEQSAAVKRAKLILVGNFESSPPGAVVLSVSRFHARFGGPVASLLPLHPAFPADMQTLSLNSLPSGMTGVPSDLYEEYVAVALQFVMARPIIPYGRSRSGEAVPDGLALDRTRYALFDAKAARNGFKFDADTIRQFGGYIQDFAARYQNLGDLTALICVSSSFQETNETLEERSRELFAKHRAPLVTITTEELLKVVAFFRNEMQLREATDWSKLLTYPVLTAQRIEVAVRAAKRDRLVPPLGPQDGNV